MAVTRGSLRWTAAGLLAAGVLTACGGGETPGESAPADTTSASVPLPSDSVEPGPAARAPDENPGAGGSAGTTENTTAASIDLSLVDPARLPAGEQAELDALFPDDPAGSVHLLVELNPAAVEAEALRGMRTLQASPAEARAQRLAAVRAMAVRLGAGHGARIKAVYGLAGKGFAAALPRDKAGAYARALAGDPAVIGLELDRVIKADAVPAPRTVNGLWGLDRIDQPLPTLDSNFAPRTSGEGVKVFVLDTGIRATHREFQGRPIGATNFVGDGRTDCHGHGTHVAATIGGSSFGVAPDVTLAAVKVLGCSGSGSSSGVIQGMESVLADSHPRRVVNMSLGGAYSAYQNSIVQRLVDQNVVVVAAAGNAGVDACTHSPASAEAALTVAAIQAGDLITSFSNHGRCVDVAAPGAGILSAGIASDTASQSMSGTSMAAPHVAGAAALLWEANPQARAGEIVAGLLQQAQARVGGLSGDRSATPNRLLFVGASGDAGTQLRAVHVEAIESSVTPTGPASYQASFRVRIADAAGRAVAAARVKAHASNSSRLLQCTTLSDGSCTLTAPSAGTLRYPSITLAIASVTPPASSDSLVIVRDAAADRVSLATAAPAAVTAHLGDWTTSLAAVSGTTWQGTAMPKVLDPDGQPVAGAYVQVRVNGGATRTCRTNDAGECLLTTGVLRVVSTPQVSFEVLGMQAPGLSYDAAANANGGAKIWLEFVPRRFAGVQTIAAVAQFANAARTAWNARITVGVRRDDGAPAVGLTVSGRWSGSTSVVSCKTTAAGSCVITAPALARSRFASERFLITNISGIGVFREPTMDSADGVNVNAP